MATGAVESVSHRGMFVNCVCRPCVVGVQCFMEALCTLACVVQTFSRMHLATYVHGGPFSRKRFFSWKPFSWKVFAALGFRSQGQGLGLGIRSRPRAQGLEVGFMLRWLKFVPASNVAWKSFSALCSFMESFVCVCFRTSEMHDVRKLCSLEPV